MIYYSELSRLCFTAEVFHKTFKTLDHIEPLILYPIPNIDTLDLPAETNLPDTIAKDTCLFLSINRYERKKNLSLTLLALGLYLMIRYLFNKIDIYILIYIFIFIYK